MTLGILINQGHNPCQTCTDSYKNGSISVQHRFLRHVGDAGVALYLHGAVVRPFHAGQDFQQGRLARAIAADQADPLLGFQ